MHITSTFGWWLIPFLISMPFIGLSIKEWNSNPEGVLAGPFSTLIAIFYLVIPLVVWLIYFMIVYFTK